MTAFVIVDIEVLDVSGYETYKALAPATIAAYGGRYRVRGGVSETLEGDWSPERLVILEFDSIEQARAWHQAAEYQEIHRMRRRYARSSMVVIEGMPGSD